MGTQMTCEVCGREKASKGTPGYQSGICFRATLDDRDCYRLGYEREKARANDEYERAEMFQRDARRSDAALVAEKARAEKAEAALEAENLGAKAEQGRLADALAVANARAEKAEADEAIAWSEVHDHEAVIRNFEKSVAKLQAALAAARRECEGLRKDPQRALAVELLGEFEKAYAETESQMTDSDRAVARRFIDVVAALAAPAAGEEGKT